MLEREVKRIQLKEKFELREDVDITAIDTMYIYHFDKSYCMKDYESHAPLELIYVDSGEEEVYEDDNRYVLSKGEAFLHKPFSAHKDGCLSENSLVYIITFETESESISRLYDQVIKVDKSNSLRLKEVFEIYYNNVDSTIDTWFGNHTTVQKKKSKFGIQQIIKNKFEDFFLNLINQFESEKEETETKLATYDSQLIQKIIEVLNEMLYEKFSLDEIAKKVSYSKSYLCRQFKQVTGSTIIDYFYSLKINEAKKLLMNDKNTIMETSDKLSFDSVQYFSKVFKKYSGLSPAVWKSISSTRNYF